MALKQQQELKQTQKLSPLQMQVIKLIELNSVELEDKIKQELEDNPALEENDSEAEHDIENGDFDDTPETLSEEDLLKGDYFSEEDIPDHQINESRRRNEPDFIAATYSNEKSGRLPIRQSCFVP